MTIARCKEFPKVWTPILKPANLNNSSKLHFIYMLLLLMH